MKKFTVTYKALAILLAIMLVAPLVLVAADDLGGGEPVGSSGSEPVGGAGEPGGGAGEPSGEPGGSGVSSGGAGEPVGEPSGEPTGEPTGEPAGEPSGEPAGEPSGEPTGEPSGEPAGEPSGEPAGEPGGEPTGEPNNDFSNELDKELDDELELNKELDDELELELKNQINVETKADGELCPVCGEPEEDCECDTLALIKPTMGGSVITGFAPLSSDILYQTHPFGTTLSQINLPENLTGNYEGLLFPASIEISVTWDSADFEENKAGTFTFTATVNLSLLPVLFEIDAGIEFPVITVVIEAAQTSAYTRSVSTLDELQAALDEINVPGSGYTSATIEIVGLFKDFQVNGGRVVTLESENVPVIITIALADRRHFEVRNGTLNLGEGITLTRAEGFEGIGGGISIYDDGTLNMTGGTITGNRSRSNGGGVTVNSNGIFNMSGGTISGNKSNNGGGGVFVGNATTMFRPTFNMSGDAIISGNTAESDGGGGVYINIRSTFNMSGNAVISGNEGKRGGGVYVLSNNTEATKFTMSDNAAIICNIGEQGGGIAFANSSCDFTISGGRIEANTAVLGGGIYTSSTIRLNAGSIVNNNAASGGGIYCDGISLQNSIGAAFELDGNNAADAIPGVWRLMEGNNLSNAYKTNAQKPENCWSNSILQGFSRNEIEFSPVYIQFFEEVLPIKTITALTLPSDIAGQTYFIGTAETAFNLPAVLTGIYDTGEVSIPVIWSTASPAFELGKADVYTYTATPEYPSGYEIAADIDVPRINITIKDSVANLAELQQALEIINDSSMDEATIPLTAAITIPADLSPAMIDSIIPVTLTVNGNRRHFNVDNGRELTLGDGVTLTRAEGYRAASNNGGGVVVYAGGTFNMIGGKIIDNRTTGGDIGGGAGVQVRGTFNMTGGLISNNNVTSATYGGGSGVRVRGGTFNMTGGEISDNSSDGFYGGVHISNKAIFEMSGGEISRNKSVTLGAGVSIGLTSDQGNTNSGTTFNMSGGVISGNTASDSGGGVWVGGGTTFNMYDGKITGNTARGGHGGGIRMTSNSPSSRVNIYGGEISGNTANKTGGGINVGNNDAGLRYLKIDPSHVDSLAPVVFRNNTVAQGGVFILDTASTLYTNTYRTQIMNMPDNDWSFGIRHGYNNCDIGAEIFPGGIPMLTVTFNINGGDLVLENSLRALLSGESLGAVNMPDPPTRENFTFLGWYTNQYGPLTESNKFTGDTVVIDSMTIYARWNPPEVLFYNGMALIQTFHVTAGEGKSLADSGLNLPSDPAPKADRIFTWNTKADGTGETFTATTPVPSSMEVYATWTAPPPPDAPGEPTDVTAEGGDGSITVTWTEPADGGEVEYYDIIITDEDGNETVITIEKDSEGNYIAKDSEGKQLDSVTVEKDSDGSYTVIIDDLGDGKYSVRVRARNGGGGKDSGTVANIEVEDKGNDSNTGSGGTGNDNDSNTGSGGTGSDNNSNTGSGGTGSDNDSNTGSGGTGSDNNSNTGSGGTGSDNNSNTGSGGTGSDNNSNTGSGGTSNDNDSNTGSGGTDSNTGSRSGNIGSTGGGNSTGIGGVIAAPDDGNLTVVVKQPEDNGFATGYEVVVTDNDGSEIVVKVNESEDGGISAIIESSEAGSLTAGQDGSVMVSAEAIENGGVGVRIENLRDGAYTIRASDENGAGVEADVTTGEIIEYIAGSGNGQAAINQDSDDEYLAVNRPGTPYSNVGAAEMEGEARLLVPIEYLIWFAIALGVLYIVSLSILWKRRNKEGKE